MAGPRARWISAALRDLRYGARALGHSPAFTLVAVLTLALTIGAVSTVLTLIYTLLWQDLGVERGEEIVELWAINRDGLDHDPVSYPDYVHLRDRTRTLSNLAAHYSSAPLFVTTDDRAQEINGAVVSANFFSLLGLEPVLGRFFRDDEDDVPGRDAVIVLSHELWQSWYGGDREVLGRQLNINGTTFTIVGVAPDSFRGMRSMPTRLFMPTMMLPVGYRWCADSLAADCTMLWMVGRLAPGQTVDDARAELATLVPPRWAETDDEDPNVAVAVQPRRGSDHRESEMAGIRLLSWVAGVLLLVCCANLAGLLISRGTARTRELAIRTSLGATPRRLLGQLLTESVLLALLGGVAGVVVSLGLTGMLNARFYSIDYAGRPMYFDFSLQPHVVLAVVGVSILAGLLFGLLPAAKAVRLGVTETLKRQGSAVSPGSRTGRWLVGAQAAAAVALVSVATLLSASAEMLVEGSNFESEHVALLRLRPRLIGYPPERAQPFVAEAVRRLEALPDVESVSMVGTGASLAGFETDVVRSDGEATPQRVGFIEVGPRYFETLKIPVLRGREFGQQDSGDAPPVAVVSEALARRLWPGGDALGSTIRIGEDDRSIVGIVKDVQLQSRADALKPYVFVPYWQNPNRIDARLQVRVRQGTDPAAKLPELVRTVHAVDPAVPISNTVTLPLNLEGRFRPLRMSATFVGYAGILALVLTALGLYGALAFAVSRRTREIGIRMAIGADPAGVLKTVLREGLGIVLVGVAVGLGLAFGAARMLDHLLYGSADADALFYVAAGAIVTLIGLAACWVPARRAARVDPMVALRDE